MASTPIGATEKAAMPQLPSSPRFGLVERPCGALVDQLDQALKGLDRSVRKDAVAEVEDMPGAARCSTEHRQRFRLNCPPRRETHSRIEVALDGDVEADPLPRFVERNPPVHADDVRTGVSHQRQELPGSDPEMDPRRRPPPQPSEDLAHGRQDEAKVVVWIERSHPAVEDLDGLGPSIDLRLQIRQDPVPELAHEVLPR